MAACVALVVAAGQGVRLGGDVPKQYRMLDGQPVLRRTLRALLDHPAVDAVRPVIDPAHRSLFDAAADGLAVLEPVAGGATRQESVRLGLESLVEKRPARVLIHDAARPFVDRNLISRVLRALDRAPGAVPAVAVSDTIKRARADGGAEDPIQGLIETTVPRDRLWRVQTPQGFRFDAILDAHRRAAGADLTDDAAVAENAGLAVAIVAGSAGNLKLTTPEDWRQAERLLAPRDVRTGMGFDVHRFGPGEHVMLCGVRIPYAAGLEGHSDADVGLHALTDAILGAIGAGDIGEHFPPSDPRWRGAPSDIFLRRAGELVAAAGGRISNVDVTIICERPRVGPHRAAMIARVAEILGLPRERVAVKATTTERLGFTGREEGIAAQAIATVALPAAEG
jgi:2-C-methyl-D-erythritol 4-phosphate cytidylyltransferase/2-C-methyl-D-erythritol 2,4-cyclodiphosphate synthase